MHRNLQSFFPAVDEYLTDELYLTRQWVRHKLQLLEKTVMKLYFDNNVFADLAFRRIPDADESLHKINKAVNSKMIMIVPSLEIFEELIPVSQKDENQFKKRWQSMHKLVNWSNTLKYANELLKDDFVCFANTGQADNPYITRKTPYYEAIDNLANMTEPPSSDTLQQITQQIYIAKGNFAYVINQAGKDWYGKVIFPKNDNFERYWSETMGPNTDEFTSYPKMMVNYLAESLGIAEACQARGLDQLLSLPTVLLSIGYWAHSWFDQVTKGRKEKPSAEYDFRHCILAAAVGTFVTGDSDLCHTIREIPGHKVNVRSLSELISTL